MINLPDNKARFGFKNFYHVGEMIINCAIWFFGGLIVGYVWKAMEMVK